MQRGCRAAGLYLEAAAHGLDRDRDEERGTLAGKLGETAEDRICVFCVGTKGMHSNCGNEEARKRAQSAVEEGRVEELRVEVECAEATLFASDLCQSVERAGITPVVFRRGLYDKTCADKVEWGEDEARNDVGGDGENETAVRGTEKTVERWEQRREEGGEDGMHDWFKSRGQKISDT